MTQTQQVSPGAPGQAVRRYFGLPLLLVCLGLFYVLPIAMIVYGAFRTSSPGTPGAWTLDGVAAAFSDPKTYEYFGNSVLLAVLVCIVTTAVSVALAWIVTRTRAVLRRIVTPLMVLVMATPPLFFALSWSLLGTPHLGLINKIFLAVGLPGDLLDVGGLGGTVLVLSLKLVSLSYFMIIGPFMAMDRRLEEASLMSGAGKVRTFLSVNVPVMAPAVAGSMVITLVIGLVSFDIPLIIGLSSGFRVFSTQIYSFVNDVTPPDYAGASSLAMVLIAVVLILVAIKWRLLDRRQFTTLSGKGANASPWDIGKWTWVCNVFVALYALLALVLPTIQLVLGSLQPAFGAGTTYSIDNYLEVLSDPFTAPAIQNSFFIGVIGGVIAVLIAFIVGVVGRRVRAAMRRVLELSTWLPWAAHGVILGLGLVWAFLTVPFLTPLFGTVWIVLIGLVVASTPLASRTTDGALSSVAPELEEAARVSGAGVTRTAFGIVGRLTIPSLIAAWLIAFVHIIGNLDVPILLSLPTNETVAVSVYNLYTTGDTSEAAALFCLVLAWAAAFGLIGYGLWSAYRLWAGRRMERGPQRPLDAIVGGPVVTEPDSSTVGMATRDQR